MNARFLSAIVFGLAITAAASAQDAPAINPLLHCRPTACSIQAIDGLQLQHLHPGISGPLARPAWAGAAPTERHEAAADHYTIKTDAARRTLSFGVNTAL